MTLSPITEARALGMVDKKAATSRVTRGVSLGIMVTLSRRLRPSRVQICKDETPTSLAISRISLSSMTAADSALPLPTARRPAFGSAMTRVSPENISISPANAAFNATELTALWLRRARALGEEGTMLAGAAASFAIDSFEIAGLILEADSWATT